MLPVEATKYSANTIANVNYQYEHYTGEWWDRDKCVAKHFSVIRREKKGEAADGIHVRMAAIPSENGDLVCWRLVSIEVNQYERYDVFADTQALKVSPERQVNVTRCTDITRLLQSWTLLKHVFHTNMDELILAHPPKLILEQGKPHDYGRSTSAMEYS